MDLSLNGKRALVTGSTAGIGYATAFELARLRAEVIVNGRSDDSVAAAVDTLSERYPGTRFHAAAMDLSNAAGAEQLIKAFPEVDVLVNSLGIFEPKPFLEIADEDWERFFQTNVMSGVRLARHYLPAMLDADWGRIVFVSSESGIHIPSEMVHYGVTKTAQLGEDYFMQAPGFRRRGRHGGGAAQRRSCFRAKGRNTRGPPRGRNGRA